MKKIFLKRSLFIITLLFCFAMLCEAKVILPALVSDGMVLQREKDILIWGKADPREQINITFRNKKYRTAADNTGNWKVTLPSMKAGGAYTMTINDIEIKNILIGDVWLCSGQSNMELPIRRVLDLYVDEVKEYKNPMIRYIKIPTSENYHAPQNDIPQGDWLELNPENALSFSALCYFFGIDLYEKTKVPVGLINSAVGGSPIEAWVSEDGLKEFPHYLHDRDLHRDDVYVEKANNLDKERHALWNSILYKEDQGLNGNLKWYLPEYNDSDWKTTDLEDASWSKDGASNINGSFWFRKEFDLSSHSVDKDAILRLGCIVDADSVFVNGVFVGTTAYQYPPRIYTVPHKILKQGKNNITVRLISYSGQARFVEDKPYKLIIGDGEIDLSKSWKSKQGVRMPAYQGIPSTRQRPTGFYNGMIAPLRNYAIKGILWYQGESNAGRAHEYYELLTSLIRDWRTLWKQNDLPFLIAQLPNFMKISEMPQESGWAEMREAQKKASLTVPYTGLAVAIDAGEWNDIHPLNKKDIAKRLSLQAWRIAYGNKKITADGPVFESMKKEGNRMILSFMVGTNDLRNVSDLKGFAIAGKDKKYKWAQTKIEGNRVIVWNDEIEEPFYVRYAWADNPEGANLKNKEDLPASPFQAEYTEGTIK